MTGIFRQQKSRKMKNSLDYNVRAVSILVRMVLQQA